MSSLVAWAPAMPGHWKALRGRDVTTAVRRELVEGSGVVTAFRDGQVTLRTNRRVDGFTEAIQEIGYQGVKVGDLVIHGMDGFAGAMGVSDSDGRMTPVVHVYEARGADARFLAAALRVAAASGYVQALARGIRERSTAFDRRTFREMMLPIPPVAEQRAIADYLDRETAQIDALIAKQRQLIATLLERRSAIARRAIWGDERFTRLPLRRLGTIVGGGTPSPDESNWNGPVPFVTPPDLRPVSGATVLQTERSLTGLGARTGSSLVPAGSVLLSTRAPIGYCAAASGEVAFNQGCRAFVPSGPVTTEYVVRALASATAALESIGRGTTFTEISGQQLAAFEVPVPTVEEQHRIVAELDAQTARIDALIEKAEQFIALAKERRAALITAAVTGQIAVPGFDPNDDETTKVV